MPTLNTPQAAFLALPHKFRAFVGGFGSGKTWVGGGSLCKHAWEHPRVPTGYFAPTYPQIRDIFYPTIDEVAFDWGLRSRVVESNKEVHLYSGKVYRSTIICRSMEKPGSIVGFKIGRGLVDEIDTMNRRKAHQAWQKIIARLRVNAPGLQNGVDVTTTPEGFNFVYEQFHQVPSQHPEKAGLYGLVHASTYDNEINLPDDYISSLFETYPEQLVLAYIDGQFCNLTSGSVYAAYDRRLNGTAATIDDDEQLHVGMDFNVLNMTAIVCVIRDDQPMALSELTGIRDTPAMIEALHENYPKRRITVYPDASGKNTHSSNASLSDLGLLRAERNFSIRVPSANPTIRSRVVSVNSMLRNARGKRRLLVNPQGCPKLAEALEKQAYDDNGMPDKTTGFDHQPDALGYFIHNRFPAAASARDRNANSTSRVVTPFTRRWLEGGRELADDLNQRKRDAL
ncbi:terminase large subunit [Xanthomonas dyei]|uniref:Terminase large subunit n=1 Tax=Xanthomonas dyei TaxID=743699 RepID=A0ABZ0D3G1_9XANT|nr:terminase family protein [Xanthomonas dyei]WOB24757.1 terminase large subunit [Xanthomonas dyei]WOB52385.1 terminase large subunit [Xanthomonas dyei]